jgi:fermentation-respiration switch protein FrsA (DUF1100 family)
MKKQSTVDSSKVSFSSEGITLAGILRSPAGKSNELLPLIIIAPSWINVKEQFAAIYGERLAMLGYHTLTFDFRNYGQSGGAPRNYEVPLDKVTDFKSAINFAAALSQQNCIYALGVCAGAGHVVMACAGDERIKKMALVASWLHDKEAVKLFYGGEEGVTDKINKSRTALQQYKATGEIIYAPKVSLTDSNAAMFGDFTYYLDSNRGLIPEWEAAKFAVMSWEPWLSYDPNPFASKISCPVLMVHSENAALPQQVKQFFANINHLPKMIYWTDGIQFDFYDGPQVDEAIGQVDAFFQA